MKFYERALLALVITFFYIKNNVKTYGCSKRRTRGKDMEKLQRIENSEAIHLQAHLYFI